MKTRKVIRIADIHISVNSEIHFDFCDSCKKFEYPSNSYDVIMNIYDRKIDEVNFYNEEFNFFQNNDITYFKRNHHIYKVKKDIKTKSSIIWIMDIYPDNKRFDIYIYRRCIDFDLLNPLMFFNLTSFLANNNSMILHSSLVDYQGKGIVFTAPSQTGKSTQANLWKKYKKAIVVNGDRTIIRKQSSYMAYGSPYAGSSRIYMNHKVKLSMIVVLRQGKKNILKKLDLKDAFLYLVSEFSILKNDEKNLEAQTKWIFELINSIPVYYLECLPNEESVNILEKEINKIYYGK